MHWRPARCLAIDNVHADSDKDVGEMKVYALAVLLALYSSSVAALRAPSEVSYSIQGDSVLVKWKHSHGKEPLHGYYVAVQEILKKLQLDAPDFVHVGRNVLSVKIKGLKPAATYEMKVVAYSNDGHEASEPIIVDTKDLELLSAEKLSVDGVTATSGLLRWDYDPLNNIHDIQFKLSCSGVRQYRDKVGEMIEEGTEFEHTAYSKSQGWEAYYATDLEPNTKYSCQVSSLAGKITGAPSAHLSFTTQYSAPVPPPSPLLESDETSFTAKLFPTVDRFGPIDHYKVFAVPVFKADTDAMSAPYTPKQPLKHILSSAVSSEAVSQAPDARPFIVGSYKKSKLPPTLKFDGGWVKSVFKPKTHYSIVVAAFTKSENSSEALCSLSPLANPPIYISADMREEWVKQNKPVGKRFTIIAVSTIVSVALIFTLAFLIAFGSNFYKGKKRDAYFYRVNNNSDSSEEELYSKRPTPLSSAKPKNKAESIPLLKLNQPIRSPTPNQTLAEWAVDNMCYNPAFDDTADQSTVIDEQRSGQLNLANDTPTLAVSTATKVQESSAPPTPLVTVAEDPMEGPSREIYGRVTKAPLPTSQDIH